MSYTERRCPVIEKAIPKEKARGVIFGVCAHAEKKSKEGSGGVSYHC